MKRAFLKLGAFLALVAPCVQPAPKPQENPTPRESLAQRRVERSPARPPRRGPSPGTTASPKILGYSPLFGLPGTVLTISGTGFGFLQGNSYVSVLSASDFHTYTTWPATSWSDTQIVVSVPNNMPLGKVYLIVEVNEQDSPGWNPFTVGIPPTISTYSPGYGDPGTELNIYGAGFGASQGSSYVSAHSPIDIHTYTTWPATSWSDTHIVVPVPNNTPFGSVYLYVTVNHLDDIGTYPFTVGIPPMISTYSPGYGDPGTELTIHGTGFGASQGGSYVLVQSGVNNAFFGWPATNWRDTQITVPVPTNMPLGRVSLYVVVKGLESIGTFPFTVGIPPAIRTYSPTSGPTGTVLTINGNGFGPTQGSGYVILQSVSNTWTALTATSWS